MCVRGPGGLALCSLLCCAASRGPVSAVEAVSVEGDEGPPGSAASKPRQAPGAWASPPQLWPGLSLSAHVRLVLCVSGFGAERSSPCREDGMSM